ncbi:MAG TPA: hypothetical protein DEB10_12110 [Ruminococcaceae bacterium]|nr:hypothetical protein [Oscillospiraceae bacterium]
MNDFSHQITSYIWNKNQNHAIPRYPRSVALGIFDGVHLGHRSVIFNACGVDLPDAGHAVSTVFTFVQPPSATKKEAGALMSAKQKKAVFKGLGVEEWILADFEEIREYSPERFVKEFLHETLDARRVCCGFNYRFGRDGSGNADTLRALCTPLGIEVAVSHPVSIDGQPVSASRIRRLIESGDIQQATRLLGHSFTLDMKVVGGQRLGHLLGAPTINQPLPPGFVRPKFGVYASIVEVDGKIAHGVTNIGVRPTVGSAEPLAETWIADFEGDLYDKNVPVTLIKFLRPEKKFNSVAELQKQILCDAQHARDTIMGKAVSGIRAVLFDFDDTLQNRPVAFMRYCDFFMHKYFPNLPQEEANKRKQDMLVRNNGGYVNYMDYFLSMFEKWGWEEAPPFHYIFREFQFRFPEYTQLFPEAIEVLKKLKERGLLIGVITNGPSLTQNRKLDVSGLRPLLDIVLVSGDHKVHKPNPEIFRRAAAGLGVACQSCIYVGDHPVNDIQGALGAGMKPIYINAFGRDERPENVTEIMNLNQLLDIVDGSWVG